MKNRQFLGLVIPLLLIVMIVIIAAGCSEETGEAPADNPGISVDIDGPKKAKKSKTTTRKR